MSGTWCDIIKKQSSKWLDVKSRWRTLRVNREGMMQSWKRSPACQLPVGQSFPGDQTAKNLPAVQETQFDPGLGRSPGEENGNLHQYSCLENFLDRGPWWAIVHGVTKSQT